MAQDPYSTLGVNRSATADEIKRAYRRLASQHHPDKGGDTQRFQEIQTAYDTLSDPQRRHAHDNPQPQGFHFNFGGGPNINDIFSQMFGHGVPPGFGGFQSRRQPNHVRMSLWVSLADIARGGNRPVALGTAQGQSTVQIEIPLGINDGDHVQYQGLAPGGQDLVIQFRVHADPLWQRNGLDLTRQLQVSIWTMIQGGHVTVRSVLDKEFQIFVPPGSEPGTQLRLRGQGLRDRHQQQGDLLVRVSPVIPKHIRPELLEAIQKYGE